jgi:small subunit ribosomal protein S11
MNTKNTKNKKKDKVVTASGRAYVTAGFNNTIVTLTDSEGNALFSSSAGKAGFKGSRKSTPYAATKATETIASDASKMGMKDVSVIVKGPGMGRIAAIKALKSGGLNVVSISDITPIPFNGCRPKKKRRV